MVVHRLDHQFFFADQLVHHQPELAFARGNHHYKHFVGVRLLFFQAVQVQQHQYLVAQLHHVMAVHPMLRCRCSSISTSLRSCITSWLSTRCSAPCVVRVISTTDASGTAYKRSPTRNSKALMMASVSGTFR